MPMTVSKTREMLVDVARQLFARMGVDNTTMNDIAQASKKGRRTLYTYFKSKNEIYLAVVESELDQLYKMLQDVAAKDLPADEKLMTFLYARLDAIKALVFRNGTLKANFFRDIWRVEKIRKSFDIRETELIQGILEAGVKEEIDRHGLKLLGVLPQDDGVYRCDCNGEPSAKLPDSDVMKTALRDVLKNIGL